MCDIIVTLINNHFKDTLSIDSTVQILLVLPIKPF